MLSASTASRQPPINGALACSSLSFLALTYGMRDVGMDFDRSIFGMKLSDCRSLARCLEYSETLTYLDLSNNTLDDDKARMLASGMINNLSVVHLDMSHNRITDRGVRALAKLLHNRSVISILNLASNQVRPRPPRSKSLGTFQRRAECAPDCDGGVDEQRTIPLSV